jgi:surface protein
MFTSSGLSTINYDNLLLGWSGLQSLQPNVTLDMDSTKYLNTPQVISARSTLTSVPNSWTINDGGPVTGIALEINIPQQLVGQSLIMFYLIQPVNVSIQWGDGTNSTGISGSGLQNHTYNSSNTFLVVITTNSQGSSLGSFTVNTDDTNIYPYITTSTIIGINGLTSFANTFKGCYNLTTLNIDNTILNNVTNTSYMLTDTSNFNYDISGWDVSNVTNMAGMFSGAFTFNQDIGNWVVSNVTNMESMFSSANAFNQNISAWVVSNVTNMFGMFDSAIAFNQNVGNWNVSNVADMTNMFINSGISTINYDNLLIGWSGLTLQQGVTLDMGTVTYSNTEQVTIARDTLTNTYSWTILDGGESCFIYGTKITCVNESGEEYVVNIEDLNDSHLIKTYLHGNRKMKHMINGTVRNGSNKELNCVYQMDNLQMLGGHSILVDCNELTETELNVNKSFFGNEMQQVDDKICLLACASDKFKKIENKEIYKWANICLENDGNIKNRYGIYANGILCETPTEEHIFSFKGINKKA